MTVANARAGELIGLPSHALCGQAASGLLPIPQAPSDEAGPPTVIGHPSDPTASIEVWSSRLEPEVEGSTVLTLVVRGAP